MDFLGEDEPACARRDLAGRQRVMCETNARRSVFVGVRSLVLERVRDLKIELDGARASAARPL